MLDSIKIKLADLHVEKIRIIDSFDFSKTLAKVRKDTGIDDPAYLEAGLHNLKRYYIVALLDPLNPHAVSQTIDPFWHAHILHTKEYIEFCNAVFNEYVQHEPLDSADAHEVERVRERYEYTLQIYGQIFHAVDSNWWPNIGDPIAVGPESRNHVLSH